MNRLVTPDEVADGIGFLLSDAARVITGIVMPIDAGWFVWEYLGYMGWSVHSPLRSLVLDGVYRRTAA